MSELTQSAQLATAIPHPRPRLATPLWWLMLLSCLAVVLYSTTYFLAVPGDKHFSRYIFPLRLHIAGGMGALLAGPWQFSEKLRARALNLHRWLGRFYLPGSVLCRTRSESQVSPAQVVGIGHLLARRIFVRF